MKKLLPSFLLLLATFVFSFTFQASVYAATITRQISRVVDIQPDASATITEKQVISWDDHSQYLPAAQNFVIVSIAPAFSKQESTIDKDITNITVKGKNGQTLQFEKSVKSGELVLKIPYYQDLRYSNNLEFTITYRTSIYAELAGGVLDVTYPGLAKNFQTVQLQSSLTDKSNFSLELKIPTSFGQVSSVYPAPLKNSTATNTTTIDYNSSQLIGNTVRMSVGSARTIRFTLSGKTYPTNENAPDFVKGMLVNYVEIALPTQQAGTEFANQVILYSKIDPYPISVRTDRDGNVIAKIPISAVKEGTILIEGYAQITAPALAGAVNQSLVSDITDSMHPYLQSNDQYWQSTATEITSWANQLKDSAGKTFLSLDHTINGVSSLLTYADATSASQLARLGALEALKQKKGVCMEYSDLSISLLRAEGIPARAVYGDGVGSRVDRTLSGVGHQWVGAWFSNVGWVPADPTWGDSAHTYIGYDLDHFVWYVASVSPNEPSGFNCQSSDAATPCKDSLEIHTTPVTDVPARSTLFTIAELMVKLDESQKNLSPIQRWSQTAVSYMGSSPIGRVVLSTQGLIVTFAVVLYTVLVLLVAAVSKWLKKRKATS